MRGFLKPLLTLGTTVCLAVATSVVFAEGSDLTSMANEITVQLGALQKLLTATSYVVGVGFAMAGIFQFKAHKENPTQTPLSKPVVMLVVAACLLFLPTLINVAGDSLFAGTPQSAKDSLSGN